MSDETAKKELRVSVTFVGRKVYKAEFEVCDKILGGDTFVKLFEKFSSKSTETNTLSIRPSKLNVISGQHSDNMTDMHTYILISPGSVEINSLVSDVQFIYNTLYTYCVSNNMQLPGSSDWAYIKEGLTEISFSNDKGKYVYEPSIFTTIGLMVQLLGTTNTLIELSRKLEYILADRWEDYKKILI